jgi:anti-sigma regulatory factor (Ser/Thr protein kinase)
MTATDTRRVRGFRHEALLYAGDDEFLEGVTRFIDDGIAHDDAVFVVVDAPKIDRLRRALDASSGSVTFADMRDVGHNPALIIQLWRDFVGEHMDSGRALRGVGEPMSAERSEAARVECHIHEALLKFAFGPDLDFWLLCPYDTAGLAGSDVARAAANHPYVRDDRGPVEHDGSHAGALDPFTSELPAPPPGAETIPFGVGTIHELRAGVGRRARAAGVDDERVAGLVLAVSEVATNTVLHGHGPGDASVWTVDGDFICELRGPGRITDPMVGRLRPRRGQLRGYGIWLANQLCDLVQIRSRDARTTVRLHLAGDRSG